jgi:bla regulator protein BlaR1
MAFSQTFIAGVDTLGAVLLHFLWQGAALGLLYALLRPLCASVGARYRLGMLVLLALGLCPVLTLAYIWPAAGTTVTTTGLSSTLTGSIAAVADSATSDWDLREFLPWLVAAWMCGVVVIGMRSLWHWRRLAHLVRHALPIPQWEAQLAQLCGRFGLLRPVRLLASANVATPMLIGWVKPVILLPLSMLSGFGPHQIELIIAHELGHVRRWDYLANLVQVVIETVLFYHPVVHWISRDVRNARENCCDDLVLSLAKGNPITYARALADLEELRHDLDVVAPALGAGGGILLARIRRIVGAEGHEALPRNNAWPVLLALAAVVCIALRPQHSLSDLAAPDRIQQNLAATLANAPAQSLAVISGVPQLAARTSPAPVTAPAAVAEAASKPVMSKPSTVRETVAVPDKSAPAQIQIARPRVDKVALLSKPQVQDIASAQPLVAALPVAEDIAPAVAAKVPTRLRVVSPVYPHSARTSRVEGTVELQYSIGADGSVRNARVLHAQPEGVFDAAALAALNQWRFEPSASLDANARYTQHFAFALTEANASKQTCHQVIGSLVCRHLGQLDE